MKLWDGAGEMKLPRGGFWGGAEEVESPEVRLLGEELKVSCVFFR